MKNVKHVEISAKIVSAILNTQTLMNAMSAILNIQDSIDRIQVVLFETETYILKQRLLLLSGI